METLQREGYELIHALFNNEELVVLREEAERVSKTEGAACVRNLRLKSELFDQLAASKQLQQLLPSGLSPVRSILFDKTPDENWPVTWHQDLTISVKNREEVEGYGPWSKKDGAVHVQPPKSLLSQMVTIRIHLDDTPESNGALRVIPKSHLRGKIGAKKVLSQIDESEVTCSCSAGDVLLMSPLILHASRRSEAPGKRRILHFEYAPYHTLDRRLSWNEPATASTRKL